MSIICCCVKSGWQIQASRWDFLEIILNALDQQIELRVALLSDFLGHSLAKFGGGGRVALGSKPG